MKRSLLIKGLLLILAVCIFAFAAVACGGDENPDTDVADKTALTAELALEVSAQGDYTAESYNAYTAALAEAKAVAADKSATQEKVDKATSDLTAARLALAIRAVETVEGASKSLHIVSGDSKQITLADYVNVNGLSKITYVIKTSNAVAELSPVTDGAFTITAGGVRVATDLVVTISVCYDGVEKAKVELAVRITDETEPTLTAENIVREYDLATLGIEESIILDFAENVSNPGGLELTYSARCADEQLTLDGSAYTLLLGTYTEEFTYTTFAVTVSFTVNGEARTLEYTYKLGLKDTGRYSIANGGFENGLDGWTLNNLLGEAPFGGIDDKTLFWVQQFPMNNVGSYFSAYADGASEASQGTLASPYFIAHGEFATYMLGGAGNPNVYVTLENRDGEVLALYRNTRFADIPEGVTDFDAQRELIGTSVFLANLVTYKVSIAEFAGEEVRFVVHDHASEGWGVVFFDELVTYSAPTDTLPEGACLAENLLADKAALVAELALEITEQGDYTADSYSLYLVALGEAKAIAGELTASQSAVDSALGALTDARLALVVRPILELEDATKSFSLVSGDAIEIILSDYFNTNSLSGVSFTAEASSTLITLSAVADGKFTVTVGEVESTDTVTVTVTAYHNGTAKLTAELSLQLTSGNEPTLERSEVVVERDLFALADKTGITLDFSENVNNSVGATLTYSAAHGGEPLTLDGTRYTFTFGEYTDVATVETFTVTVSYEVSGDERSISYTYTLKIKDTTANRLANGSFENGLEGWTQVGNIGGVSSDTHYWVGDPESSEGYEFGMDGEWMFSAYAPGALESAVGTLTSSTFTVGGSGFITFKLGAMKDGNYVYVDVVDAETKVILARYYNGLWAERTEEVKSGCTLVAYKADLSAFIGKEVFLRISDNADSGYGLFFLDSFNTYYASEPEGFNAATAVNYTVSGTIYDLFNGGFELGDVQGWWNNGEIGVVTDADGYWGENISYGKDGEFLFTGVESFGADTMREANRGTLTSSAFELGGVGYITFMLGGGGNQLCFVQIIDATTGEILARYHQQAQQDAVLIRYVADLSEYIGRTVRIQVVDQAESGWGCVSFDNVVTYYTSTEDLPEGISATDIKGNRKHTLDNGSFETGDLEGWTVSITEPGTHNTLGWVTDTEIDAGWYTKNGETKDGDYLFTFVLPDDTNCENTKGTLESSTFSLKQGSFVAFKFGAAGGAQNHDVYVELCRADGSVIARFYNDAEGKVNTKMNSYYYQYEGVEIDCFFRVVDNSTSDYGCFVVDAFEVNLESAPEGYVEAIQ